MVTWQKPRPRLCEICDKEIEQPTGGRQIRHKLCAPYYTRAYNKAYNAANPVTEADYKKIRATALINARNAYHRDQTVWTDQ